MSKKKNQDVAETFENLKETKGMSIEVPNVF